MVKQTPTPIHCEYSFKLSLTELTLSFGVNKQTIFEIIDEGIISPPVTHDEELEFDEQSLRKIRTVLQLKQDLGVNLAGAALAIELLDKIDELRNQLESR